MNTLTKNTLRIILCLFLLSFVVACGTSEPKETPTDAPLTIWEFEKVCRQGVIDEATAYDAGVGKVHPILLFERDAPNENDYSSMTNSILKLPETWMVDYQGDATTVELVACITRISDEFVETCEYEDDEEEDKVYLLDVHNASYEIKVFTATTGDELGSTTLDAAYDDCPMFHMFSGGDEKEQTFASLEGGDIQAFLEQFVQP